MQLSLTRLAACALLAPVLLLGGCGIVADKDLIEVAQLGDRTITRGEMYRAIRLLPPDEKPSIRTRGDVRDALLDYIDTEIKTEVANKLEDEGTIGVSMEEAAQYYFSQHPEKISVFQLQDPSAVGMTQADLEAEKANVQEGVEHMRRRLLNELAMSYLVQQANETGSIEISDEEWQREYTIQKSRLMHPAKAHLVGVAVPATSDEAQRLAAEARRRIEEGADIETLAAEYRESNQGTLIDTTVANDGRNPQFQSFWQEAEGAKAGDLIGPVFLQGQQRMVPNEQGGFEPRTVPPLFLVARIDEITEAQQMTLEEAKPVLVNQILYTRVLRDLRDEHGVEVFDDKLPDPAVEDVGLQAGPVKAPEGQTINVPGGTGHEGHDHAPGEHHDHDHEGHDHAH